MAAVIRHNGAVAVCMPTEKLLFFFRLVMHGWVRGKNVCIIHYFLVNYLTRMAERKIAKLYAFHHFFFVLSGDMS